MKAFFLVLMMLSSLSAFSIDGNGPRVECGRIVKCFGPNESFHLCTFLSHSGLQLGFAFSDYDVEASKVVATGNVCTDINDDSNKIWQDPNPIEDAAIPALSERSRLNWIRATTPPGPESHRCECRRESGGLFNGSYSLFYIKTRSGTTIQEVKLTRIVNQGGDPKGACEDEINNYAQCF